MDAQANMTMWTAITALLGIVSTIALQLLAMKRAKQDREQDRADKLLEAEITGKFRKKLEKEVQQTKAVAAVGVRKAAEAISTSNGIKENLYKHGVKLITPDEPLPVQVVNDDKHPIPVHDENTQA